MVKNLKPAKKENYLDGWNDVINAIADQNKIKDAENESKLRSFYKKLKIKTLSAAIGRRLAITSRT